MVRLREPKGYARLVRKYEREGLTTSDAQGCADVQCMRREAKAKKKAVDLQPKKE